MQKRIYTDDQVKEIIKLYNDAKSVEKIASIVNGTDWTIRRVLIENGIKLRSKTAFSRKYPLDETFFEKIDTSEKAYWLGFLYADGVVYKERGGGAYFHLTLQHRDKVILEKFKDDLKTTKSIFFYPKRNHDMLMICSNKMFDDLVKLGCVRRKSLILEFPTEQQVPIYLMGDFLRGFFDGDGSSGFSLKNWRFEAKVISTLSFCNSYKEFLSKEVGIKTFYDGKIKYSKNDKLPYTTVGIGNYEDVKKLYNFFYKNNPFCLERKKRAFIEYLEYKKNLATDLSHGLSNNRLYDKVELTHQNGTKILLRNVNKDAVKFGLKDEGVYALINGKKKNGTYKGFRLSNIERL